LPPLTTKTEGTTAGRTVRRSCAVAFIGVGVVESVAWSVNVLVPAVVGVPPIEPFGNSTSPGGSAPPTTLQVTRPTFIAAVSGWL
jgi:hypothetical protein